MKRGRGGRARKEQGREGEGEGCYLDSIGRLFESDQHIPVSSAGRVPGTELRARVGTGGREGSTEARLPVAEGSLVAPTVPHTQGRPSAALSTHSSPTWARPSRARSQLPPARPRGGGGVPAPAEPAVALLPPALPPAGHRVGVAAGARSVGTFMKVSTAPLAVSR